MADTTSLDATLKLLQLFGGKNSTTTQSGGTTTQKTDIDQNTLNATLKSALESNQGLASIAAGQAQSGMYNSTVNTQLSNDLLSRLTSDVAAKTATTTKTSTPVTTTTSGSNLKDSILPLAVMAGGKKAIDKMFGYGTDVATKSDPTSAISSVFDGHGGMDAAFSASGDAVTSASDAISSSISSVSDVFTGGSGFDSAVWGIGDSAGSAASAIADSGAGEGFDSLGTELLDKGTVICTEAARQGLIAPAYFRAELAHLVKHPLNPTTRAGYHKIAAPVVARMKADLKVAEYFAKWAKAYIYGDVFGVGSWRYYFVRFALLPLCWVIGNFVKKSPAVLVGV